MCVSLLNCCTTFHCSTPLDQCNVPFHFSSIMWFFCPLIILQIFSDVACHRKILDAKVKCPNRDCTWTGELRDVRVRIDHFTLRFFAPFQPSTLFNLCYNQMDTSLWRFWRISHKLFAHIPSFSRTWYIWTRGLNFSIAVLLRISVYYIDTDEIPGLFQWRKFGIQWKCNFYPSHVKISWLSWLLQSQPIGKGHHKISPSVSI